MIVTWIVSCFTFGIYGLYVIYTSYKDQNEFNNQMEYYILKRSKELKGVFAKNSKNEIENKWIIVHLINNYTVTY